MGEGDIKSTDEGETEEKRIIEPINIGAPEGNCLGAYDIAINLERNILDLTTLHKQLIGIVFMKNQMLFKVIDLREIIGENHIHRPRIDFDNNNSRFLVTGTWENKIMVFDGNIDEFC